jgi:hypothetical protein
MIETFPVKKSPHRSGKVLATVLALTLSIFQSTDAVATNNTEPTISGSPATRADAGSYYFFKPSASDPDGDRLSFSITNRPSWLNFVTNTGRLSGVPYSNDTGTTSNIQISVSDGTETVSLPAFSITVNGADTQSNDTETQTSTPELGTIGSRSITAGNTLSFNIYATDNDGTIPLLDAAELPPNAVFVDNHDGTGTFTWPTTSSYAGTWNITFTATDAVDSMLTNSETVTILVLAANNTGLTISGSPATRIDAGSYYFFKPSASDPDGRRLSFSITNRPSWLNFVSNTGRLSGVPYSSATGTTSNIQISVSDGTETVSLPAFSITVNGAETQPNDTETQTGSITLSWVAPVARTDGSPIAMSEIAGFTVYYGTSIGRYPNTLNVNNGSATSATIADLPVGTYYLVVTTRDNEGRESGYSDELAKVVN